MHEVQCPQWLAREAMQEMQLQGPSIKES